MANPQAGTECMKGIWKNLVRKEMEKSKADNGEGLHTLQIMMESSFFTKKKESDPAFEVADLINELITEDKEAELKAEALAKEEEASGENLTPQDLMAYVSKCLADAGHEGTIEDKTAMMASIDVCRMFGSHHRKRQVLIYDPVEGELEMDMSLKQLVHEVILKNDNPWQSLALIATRWANGRCALLRDLTHDEFFEMMREVDNLTEDDIEVEVGEAYRGGAIPPGAPPLACVEGYGGGAIPPGAPPLACVEGWWSAKRVLRTAGGRWAAATAIGETPPEEEVSTQPFPPPCSPLLCCAVASLVLGNVRAAVKAIGLPTPAPKVVEVIQKAKSRKKEWEEARAKMRAAKEESRKAEEEAERHKRIKKTTNEALESKAKVKTTAVKVSRLPPPFSAPLLASTPLLPGAPSVICNLPNA
ncbi:hypothetical protein CYMTET_42362 [Cymbomonas tetramitiformis]|uniref:Uncharacterized protein n=1 Tax=Cymbomonas tetramitiformis TaxID=36881 RepID=A0AAE0C601_9CHLO|nr:hypothetical protein CYMTET_42362 [Cymbomonas tetramitiformis]